jgi:septum formation protein
MHWWFGTILTFKEVEMYLKNLENKKILLASKSPRRKQLLQNAGIQFELINSKEVEEIIPDGYANKKAAEYLAELKASAYEDEIIENTLLIAADTIVCLKNDILGKPKDHTEAFDMIKSLSGKKHKVITGVCIRSSEKKVTFSATTKVYFKQIPDDEINFYITEYMPFDKAGAYGIQEWIGHTCIEKIKGSYFNVMGMPIQRLYEELKNF